MLSLFSVKQNTRNDKCFLIIGAFDSTRIVYNRLLIVSVTLSNKNRYEIYFAS